MLPLQKAARLHSWPELVIYISCQAVIMATRKPVRFAGRHINYLVLPSCCIHYLVSLLKMFEDDGIGQPEPNTIVCIIQAGSFGQWCFMTPAE